MCLQLEQSINKRFSGIVKRLSPQILSTNEPFADRIYFVCAVLDPQFKFHWISQMNCKPTVESQIKQTLIQMIMDECEHNVDIQHDSVQHQPSSSSTTSIVNSHTTQSIGTAIIKKHKLFQYDDRNLSFNYPMNPVDELTTCINDQVRTKFPSSWKNSQVFSLKHVIKGIFSIQVSSASIERVFSQVGVIMSLRQTSMREDIFRNLVFLCVNNNLIYEIV